MQGVPGGLGRGRPAQRAQRLPSAPRGQPFFPGEPVLLGGAARVWPASKWTLAMLAEEFRGTSAWLTTFGCKDNMDSDEGDSPEGGDEDIDECYASERDLGDFFSSIGSMRIDSAHEQGLQVRMLRESPDIIASHPRLWRDLYPSTLLVGYKDFVRRQYSFEASLWAGPANATTGLHADLDPAAFLVHLGPGAKELILFPASVSDQLVAEERKDGGHYPPARMDLFSENLTMEYPCVAALRDHPHMVRETLSPGDVLFIPCGWFHQVRYVNEASVSVTVIASHPQATAEGLSVATCAKHTRPL